MLLAIAEDVRVVLIKLAERVVYLRSLTRADDALRRAAGRQTLELFAPLANRLGVSDMKWELEDFAFRYTEPELYKRIAQLLDEKRSEREAYIQRVIAQLHGELSAMGIEAAIQGRPKHIYSIWRKMRGKNVSFEGLYDIRAVRVIVQQRARVLHGAGRGARPVDAGRGRVRRLHREPEVQRLQVAAHRRGRPRGQDARGADPHRGDAPAFRARRGGALALQGRHRAPTRPSTPRSRGCARCSRGRRRCSAAEVGDASQARPVRGHDLRAHAAGARRGPARGFHAARLRLPRAHRPRPPLPRRQGRRPDGAARLQARERAARGDHGGQAGRALARLDRARPGLPREPARDRQGAPVVPPRGLTRRTWPSGRAALDKELHRLGAASESHEKIAAACRFRQARRFPRGARPRRGERAPDRDRGARRARRAAARAGGAARARAAVGDFLGRARAGREQHRDADRQVLQAGAARTRSWASSRARAG